MKRPLIDAIMDGCAFCWLGYIPSDKLLYEIWLRWETRYVGAGQK